MTTPKTHERSTMPSTQNAGSNHEYRNVPLTALVESRICEYLRGLLPLADGSTGIKRLQEGSTKD